MSAKMNKKNKAQVVINPKMRDYSKDPFFVKKAEEATAFLKEHGLPERVAERIKKKSK